jgi:hypothetical protein
MVAPIFNFRNVKLDITTTDPVFVYGIVEATASGVTDPQTALVDGVDPSEVSTVVLTIQISNHSGSNISQQAATTVPVTVYLRQGTSVLSPIAERDSAIQRRRLVHDYPLISNNSFDPLNGNLVLTAGDQIWIQVDTPNAVQVIVSMLEIANATAS